MSDKTKLDLEVEVHETGAVSCDGVRYGPGTGVARFLSMKVHDRDRLQGRLGRIAERIAAKKE